MLQGERMERQSKSTQVADAVGGRGTHGVGREQQKGYTTVKKEISAALTQMEFVSLNNFHRHKLRPGEALSVFVHNLKEAMPGPEENTRNQLLLHQFLSGLLEAVSKQL